MPKPDLYTILGVGKTADKKTIKTAYRKRAKKMHPDHGGTPEKFGALQRAHDVLLDDERRAKYDATGDIDEKTPDNAFSQAVNTVAFAFSAVLQECASAGQSPLELNIVESVKGKINGTIGEARKQIRILKNMLETDKKLTGRFTSKKENIFEGIVANRITSIQINLKNFEDTIKNCEAGLELIKDANFKRDEKPYESPGDAMMRRMGNASGWGFL